MRGKQVFQSSIAIVLSSIVLASCTPTLAMAPIPIKDEKIVYNAGNPVLVEKTPTGIVAVSTPSMPFEATDGRASVYVYFKNLGKKEQNFSTDNIKVHEANGSPLKVYSYQTLVEEENARAKSAELAAVIDSASRSYEAGQAGYQHTYGTASALGPEGFAPGTYSATTYNAGAAEQARLQANAANQREMANVEAQHNLKLGILSKSYLKIQTVVPGMLYGGMVTFDVPNKPDGAIVDIDVSTSSGTESFQIKLQKAQ